MAPSPLIMLVVIATIFLPSIAMAKEFVVGDDHGWTIGFNYAAWAADKTFQVGDTLVFNYDAGKHNVFKVNGTLFQSCTVPPASEGLHTGSDSIVLETPGRKWYICGFVGHCNAGQKLVITVQPQNLPPTPAPSPLQHHPHFGGWVPKKLFRIFH
ncbi:mavicyanin-like [Cajanus cajan]|uniref:Blue copper protein n=1 Tax=Cajanus cajan TaxID=3821 RepID=A0A151QQM9_CAJCA|nr:mavicyanin-like [Cajanus cajan]KYP32586.1 Blue copper protein [Cajanus cajan]